MPAPEAGLYIPYTRRTRALRRIRRVRIPRTGPGLLSFVLGVGLVTPFHWSWLIPVPFMRLRGTRVEWGPDAVIVPAITGIPQFLVILIALASAVLAYWFVVTAIPRGRRVRVIVPTLVGAAVVGGRCG